MKSIKYIIGLFLSVAFIGCEKEEYTFGDIKTPTELKVDVNIIGKDDSNPYGDGSGVVVISAQANDAITYKFNYNGTPTVAPSGTTTYNFAVTGTSKYIVTVEAVGTGGVTTSKTVEMDVLVLYEPPADLLTMLVSDGSRSWRIKSEEPGHFGVGPPEETSPIWYAAGPFEKSVTGMYDDRYVFSKEGTMTHITNSTNDDPDPNPEGTVFGQADPMRKDLGDTTVEPNPGNEFENYPLNDYTEQWSLSAPDGVETLTLTGNAFLGFYVGGDHKYQIISRSANEMFIKTIGNDGLSWFFLMTNKEPEGKTVDVNYTNLVWSDEFDTDGAPSAENWTYDIGLGDNGWGNNESQYYTDRPDNVKVEEGMLKITAKAEEYQGSSYTSARVKSQGLREFKYGRIDVRAKLPEGGGTWPAIWTLGANIDEVGWPACGEIDIMEYVGNNPNVISAAIHTPSSSGATENTMTTTVDNVSSTFHIYSVNWSENEISFLVDDKIYYTYKPDVKNAETWPFDSEQFIILNIAMGGTLGGEIDAQFTESTMEIDYVKVYQ